MIFTWYAVDPSVTPPTVTQLPQDAVQNPACAKCALASHGIWKNGPVQIPLCTLCVRNIIANLKLTPADKMKDMHNNINRPK
jgi:hypothetical protein